MKIIKKNVDIRAVERLQQIMTKNEIWLLSHAELDFNAVIRPQKNWPDLMTAIKKAARDGLGGSIRFVSIEIADTENWVDAIFKVVLLLKRKPITLQLSVVKIYE